MNASKADAQGMFVKYIQAETGARVQIKGRGSGFIENDTGREGDEAMHISIVAPTDDQIQRAKILADDLLMVLRIEYDKARGVYSGAGYDSYGGAAVQGAHGWVSLRAIASASGCQRVSANGAGEAGGAGDAGAAERRIVLTSQTDQSGGAAATDATAANAPYYPPAEGPGTEQWEAYAAYWRAYGYDVNDAQCESPSCLCGPLFAPVQTC